MEQPDAATPPKRSTLAWVLTVAIVVVVPVLLFISAIPTMAQGGELKDAATCMMLSGGTGVLIVAIVARIVWRRSGRARRVIPVLALIAVSGLAAVAFVLMWASAQQA